MSVKSNVAQYQSDPHVTFLSQLLDELKSGLIQVPKFQRPFVWRWEDRLELLRSIRDGIPMGAVMVWRSTGPRIECFDTLGRHRIPRVDASPQYLLDGVQRLSTLLGALTALDEIDVDSEDFLEDSSQPPAENFSIHYDFEMDDFVRASDVDPEKGVTLPMELVLDTVGMVKFQRNLMRTSRDSDEIFEKCDDLTAAFREYKVPVIPIVTGSIEMATRTFQRLNSQGSAMSEAHMIHALSWDAEFNLNSRISEVISTELKELGWEDIDADIILKASKYGLGFGIYSKNADHIGAAFKSHTYVIDEVGKACRLAIEFLKNRCRITIPSLLPYSLQLVLLTDVFREHGAPDENQISGLESWFWATTYGEYFAGMSGDRFDRARKDLAAGLGQDAWSLSQSDVFSVRPIARKFDFRSVRAKAFSLRLAERLDTAYNNSSGMNVLSKHGRECVSQILPRTSPKKIIYSSYANRFLVAPKAVPLLKEALLLSNLSDEEMWGHLVDTEMMSALRRDAHDHFIALREERIAALEKEFYSPHLRRMNLFT